MKHVIRAATPLRRAMETRAAGTKRPEKEVAGPGRTLLDDLDELRLDLLTGKK